MVEATEPSLLLALSNAAPIHDITRFLYNGLYKLDNSLAPVPDLAAEPCAIANGGLTITCRLRPATFHDGSPVTADDVVESYRIALSPVCAFEGAEGCLMTSVDEVVALDDRTVELRLNRSDPTVLTLLLPGVFIYSKRQIEADAAPFLAAAPGLDAAAYAAAAEEIEAAAEAGVSDPDGVCGPAADRAEELLAAAGLGADWEPYFAPIEPVGPPDRCFLARYLGGVALRAVAESLELEGVDRIARIFRLLALNRRPIGTGAWKLGAVDLPRAVTLEAFADHHFGPPATPNVQVRLFTDFLTLADQVRTGAIQWWLWAPFEFYRELRSVPGLTVVEYPDFSFTPPCLQPPAGAPLRRARAPKGDGAVHRQGGNRRDRHSRRRHPRVLAGGARLVGVPAVDPAPGARCRGRAGADRGRRDGRPAPTASMSATAAGSRPRSWCAAMSASGSGSWTWSRPR